MATTVQNVSFYKENTGFYALNANFVDFKTKTGVCINFLTFIEQFTSWASVP